MILEATDELMNSIGFELKGEEEAVLGSFFQKLFYQKKKNKSEETINENLSRVLSQINNQGNVNETERLTMAVANLVNNLDAIDEYVIKLGTIVVIKVIIGDKSRLIAQIITPEVNQKLSDNPQLLKLPNQLYELMLNDDENINNTLNETFGEKETTIQDISKSKKIKKQIKKLLGKGKFESAFELCEQVIKDEKQENRLLTQYSRFNNNKQEFNDGIIDYEKFVKINNKITKAMLEFIDEL